MTPYANYQTAHGPLYYPFKTYPTSAPTSFPVWSRGHRRYRPSKFKRWRKIARKMNFRRPRTITRLPPRPKKFAKEVHRISVRMGDTTDSFAPQQWAAGSTFYELSASYFPKQATGLGAVNLYGSDAPTQGTGEGSRTGDYIWISRISGQIELSYELRDLTTSVTGSAEECMIRLVVIVINDDSSNRSQGSFKLDDFYSSSALSFPHNITSPTYLRKSDQPTGERNSFSVLKSELIHFDPNSGSTRGKDQYLWKYSFSLGKCMYDINANNAMIFGPGQRIIFGIFSNSSDTTTDPFWRGNLQMHYKDIS